MAAAALKDHDKNSNGSIEGSELDAVPALKSSLTQIDKNGDKKLSSDELKARFEAYKSLGAGAVAIGVDVSLNGEPLQGAIVTFTPEACMLGTVKPATGTTSDIGSISDFKLDGSSYPGLPCGLYKITVSKKDESGKETLQEKYVSGTALGGEFFEGGRGSSSTIILKLTSK